jgi:hypothetical protein
MNGWGFQALVAQLGEFSEGQHKALLTALRRKLPVDEAIALIDTRFKISRLKQWLARFKCVATHYLPSYLGWRRLIEPEGEALSPARFITHAPPQTSN